MSRKCDTVCVVPDLIRDGDGRRFRRELIDREGQANSNAQVLKDFPMVPDNSIVRPRIYNG